MDQLSIEVLGLIAGAVTSMGFIPQLFKGYKTKKLDDVSSVMPLVLAFGMTLWFFYGYFLQALAIMVANGFSIGCCVVLLSMKKKYEIKKE